MARLYTAGLEEEVGTNKIEPSLTTATRDTGVFRSGAASLKADSGVGNVLAYGLASVSNSSTAAPAMFAASTTGFARVCMRFDNAPSSAVYVFGAAVDAISLTSGGVGAKLTAGGKLQLFNVTAGTQIGSDSAATLLMDGSTWYRLELSVTKDASNNMTAAELRLDGVSVASASGLSVSSITGNTFFGWLQTPGASKICHVDDIAINDSTGATQNTWAGDGKIVLLRPTALSVNGGSWTDDAAATTSAALANAVDNTPPNGIADTTAGGGNHQVRNSAANTSLDMTLTTYAAAGVAAADVVNVLLPIVNVGAPVVTGAKTGSYGITTNPTIANRTFTGGATAAANFWAGSAPGTFPAGGWRWEMGTATEAPTVTVGTAPVARLTIIAGTVTRIAMCDAMHLYVDYTPAVVAAATQTPNVNMAPQRA